MGFFDQLTQCKPCSQSDPTEDTVKVDPSLLTGGKENAENLANIQNIDERLQTEKKLREAEEEMLRQAEAQAAEEKRRAEGEARRKREEQTARAAAEASAKQESEKAAQEKRRQAQEQAAREAQRKAEFEQARFLEEARTRQEEEELRKAQARVQTWCKANGYANINSQKKKLFGASKFPLHEAVFIKDLELVQSLVKCGADKSAKNTKGQTACDLATKNNRHGSMDAFLAALV